MHKNTPYNFVIVLCASPLNKNDEFEELSPDGSYLGGKVRMQAAVDLWTRKKVEKIIVVGGGIKEKNEDKKFRKVNDMKKYLEDGGIPQESIIRVISEADTHGNMRAIYKTIKEKLDGKLIGILTNFYHLSRAMRVAHDPQFEWGLLTLFPFAQNLLSNRRRRRICVIHQNFFVEFSTISKA